MGMLMGKPLVMLLTLLLGSYWCWMEGMLRMELGKLL